MDISAFIFLAVVMLAFGYIAGNARSFNFWKLALLGLVLLLFVTSFNFDKAHLLTMLGAFLVGYLLPFGHFLEGIGEALSDTINAIRYRDAYEDIRRKEAEVEELRRKYEGTRRRRSKEDREKARERRRQESENTRSQQQNSDQETSSKGPGERERVEEVQQEPSISIKSQNLRTLGLEPEGHYEFQDIKKAFRRQAMKYHPERHVGKSAEVIKEMTKRFQEVKQAYDWLAECIGPPE